MENKLILKEGFKKYGVSITLILFVIFVLAAIAVPKLSATRDDALRAKAYYEKNVLVTEESDSSTDKSYNLEASLFEIKRYEIKYQTNKTLALQKKIKILKKKPYVLFDKYDESKSKSSYILKVKRAYSKEVLSFLEELSPTKIHLYVENIKKSIDASVNKEKLLKEKLSKLEIILNDATQSYTKLLILAQEKNDIDALTKLVELKIDTLNRLTNEKNSILSQITTLTRKKKELFERLNYVIFKVVIDEFLYIDMENLKNSWKYDIKALISNFNSLIQSLTTTLFSFMLKLAKFFIYFIIMLFILKLIIFIIKKVFKLEEISLFEKGKDEV